MSDIVQEMIEDLQSMPEWFINDLKKRREFGLKKYGKGVDEKDGHDWLNEAREECLDAVIYLAAHTKLVGEGEHVLAYYYILQALTIINDQQSKLKIITE